MKIAFVCHEYPPSKHGGIGTFTQVLGRALAAAGHQVRVIGVYSPGQAVPQTQNDAGVQVTRLEQGRWDRFAVGARRKLLATLQDWISTDKVEVIEVPDAEGWAFGWPRLRVPVVVRCHGSATYFARELKRPKNRRSGLLRWMEGAALQRADFWCSVSRYTAERTAELFDLRKPPAISYVPVEPIAPPGVERSRTQVLYTGTLTPKKGLPQLLAAWPQVRRACPHAELHVYGKDTFSTGVSLRESLEKRLPEDVRSSVQFRGHVPRTELLRALAAARAAVFPSYAEAFAFAPVEAMLCGCPTVYSRRTSGPELIEHGRDGLLVDPDDREEIAKAIVALLEDHSLAARLGAAGRERVLESFTTEKRVPAIADYYRQCISKFSERRSRPEATLAAAGARS